MTSTEDRLEFAPPRDKASPRAFGLALGVHVLLIAALTWGVNWKRTDEAASFEAEMWSGVPQPAAPRQIQAPPAPAPTPAPTAPAPPAPAPPPPAPPVAKAPVIKETPPVPDVDIALEKEKQRKLLQQQKETEVLKAQKLQEKREAELQARQAKEQERKKEKEQQAREDLAERKARETAEKAEARKQEARQLAIEKEKEKEKEKRTAAANAAAAEKQKEAAAEKQKQAAAEKQKAATAAANAEKQKEAATAAAAAKQKAAAAAGAENAKQAAIQKRIMDMAGAGVNASASAGKSSEPSAGYAGKVRARVLPNVVFNDDIAGNPVAEVTVTTTADGTIMSQKLSKSSGNKAWDDAVIKAIVRTGSLPRDIDGRVPTPMIIEFRPN